MLWAGRGVWGCGQGQGVVSVPSYTVGTWIPAVVGQGQGA